MRRYSLDCMLGILKVVRPYELVVRMPKLGCSCFGYGYFSTYMGDDKHFGNIFNEGTDPLAVFNADAHGFSGYSVFRLVRCYSSSDPDIVLLPTSHIYRNIEDRFEYYRAHPFDWVSVELHLSCREGLLCSVLYLNGNKMPNNYCFGESIVTPITGVGAKRGYYISGLDFVEFSTDSYSLNGSHFSSSGEGRSELCLKDIEVVTIEKGDLLSYIDFSSQYEEGELPVWWDVSVYSPNYVRIEESLSDDNDYNINFGLWDYYYRRSGITFHRFLGTPAISPDVTYTVKVSFDCINSSYVVYVNNNPILPPLTFSSVNYLDYIFLKIGGNEVFRNPSSIKISNFKVYDENDNLVIEDNFDDGDKDGKPLTWSVYMSDVDHSRVFVDNTSGLEAHYDKLTDETYTVVFAHPSNVLSVSGTGSYAKYTLPRCYSGSIYLDFLVSTDISPTYYYILLLSNNVVVNQVRINSSFGSIEGFSNGEWISIDSSNIWTFQNWHQIKFDFNSYSMDIYLDSIYRGSVLNHVKATGINGLKIMTDSSSNGKIHIDNIRYYDSSNSLLYNSDFNTVPSGLPVGLIVVYVVIQRQDILVIL